MSQASLTSPRVADSPARSRSMKRILRPFLMLGGIAVVVIGAGLYWLSSGRVVSIDDAYVRAAKETIATDVSGIVQEVAVREGQRVNQGDVLLRLDPRPFQIALDGAEASLAQTALQLEAMKHDYSRMLRDVDARAAQVEGDQAIYDRRASLVKSGSGSRADYDNARFALAAGQHSVASLRAQAEMQLARLGGNAAIDVKTMPDYLQVESRVAEARRQLDHAVVRAPFSGIMTQVESVQPGMYLAAATPAFGLVSTERLWIEANPKETELTHVKIGDPVEVSVDTYPGRQWQGVVESISPNTGSEFSILPAQNTSGNWVKVVQRIPLRIRVERAAGDPELRAGMSVEANIDTGHRRSWRDLLP